MNKKRLKKIIVWGILSLVCYFVLINVSVYVMGVIGGYIHSVKGKDINQNYMMNSSIIIAQAIILVLMIMIYKHINGPKYGIHEKKPFNLYGMLWGILLCYMSIGCMKGIVILIEKVGNFGIDTKGNIFSFPLNNQVEIIMMIITAVILAPLVEEIMMRGIIFGGLRKEISFWPASIISSAIFGIMHWDIAVGISMFAMGMMQCFIYEAYKNLKIVIGVHFVNNLVAIIISFFAKDVVGGKNVGVNGLIETFSMIIYVIICVIVTIVACSHIQMRKKVF